MQLVCVLWEREKTRMLLGDVYRQRNSLALKPACILGATIQTPRPDTILIISRQGRTSRKKADSTIRERINDSTGSIVV